MQISILAGSYTDGSPSMRTSYPVNRVPVSDQTGISNGYLRPADGISLVAEGPGIGRGGILWNGICYRVMGSKLVSVADNGTITTIGDVGNDGKFVSMDYSFDRLAIASNGNLFYYNGSALSQVTDPDLGTVLDSIWIDGYFMTTDGEFLVVTELNDPTQINPLKYGSSELDPDPIKAIKKLRNEVYAVNRYTVEAFDNVGGEYFPFQRIDGAQIPKGSVGTHTCCVYHETIAFLGGGRNEQPSIYLGLNGVANKIASREIEEILKNYTEAELSSCKMEVMNDRSSEMLYVHLPDRTIVYDWKVSQDFGSPVWFILTSAVQGFSRYRANNFVYGYNKWLVSDPTTSKVGYFTDTVGEHWGEVVRWEFGTSIVYNDSNGVIFNELELIALTGSIALGSTPVIQTSYSLDGIIWSQPKLISVGTTGSRSKRLRWFRQGHMRNWRIQRFQGDSTSHLSFARLEAQVEQLGR